MPLLFFFLVMLVFIDHAIKYKRQSLIYYKNKHRFSVVVAIVQYSYYIEKLFEFARESEHEFIFVDVNGSLPDYPDDVRVFEVNQYIDPEDPNAKTKLLEKAYKEGYEHTENEFLLFLDADLHFENYKILKHMANNLVEHQVYTLKETYPFRDYNQGYKLFFDFFREMNVSSDRLNHSFFAVKRKTFELPGCQAKLYDCTEDFEEDIERKNISIVHIDHNHSVRKGEVEADLKSFLRRWIDQFAKRKENIGIQKMLLFLLALHGFYFAIVYDFSVLNLALLAMVHAALYLLSRRDMKQHPLQFVFIPFYMLFFDVFFLWGGLKRLFLRKIRKEEARS